jgi:dihydroorotase
LSRGEIIWTEGFIDARPGRGKFLEGLGKKSEQELEETE